MSSKTHKRYTLVLPEDLFTEVRKVAENRQTTVVDILRRFIKLGLIAVQVEDTPDTELIVREKDKEWRLILL